MMQFMVLLLVVYGCLPGKNVLSDDVNDFISPEDLEYFNRAKNEHTYDKYSDESDEDDDVELRSGADSLDSDCFGFNGFTNKLKWLFNFRPTTSDSLETKFYLTTRKLGYRLDIESGDQLTKEWSDFKPQRRTIILTHGFMSHSNASWVLDLTAAFLHRDDVNVITVDWSKGGRTWKYWRAVANTRTVGLDLYNFLAGVINATGASTGNFHFVGHSLGAHISSFAASRLGGVKRITGLDPAQPCFRTTNKKMILDKSDAEYVDVIHTNGRLVSRIGFGMPDPSGHADFYPNGGMKQPGCFKDVKKGFIQSVLPISNEKLQKAMCSHRRAHLYLLDSLLNQNCTFIGHQWDMSFSGVNASMQKTCEMSTLGRTCGIMGIGAYNEKTGVKSMGTFYVITRDEAPFCTNDYPDVEGRTFLLRDLLKGHVLNKLHDKEEEDSESDEEEITYAKIVTTPKPKKSGWWIFG